MLKKEILEKTKRALIKNERNGITLIALAITIIVLLILAGVSIATLTGDSGIITKASESEFKSYISSLKEDFDLYLVEKKAQNQNFDKETLNANEEILTYNTQDKNEKGNIKTVLSRLEDGDERIEVIQGKLVFSSLNQNELSWVRDIGGIDINPYNITDDATLESSDSNLFLVDKNGTLVLPSNVTKIANGAFANVEGLKK